MIAFADFTVETRRLALRPLASADAEASARLTNHPAVAPAIHFLPYPFEHADATALIARNRPDAEEVFLGLFHAGALVGVLGIHAHPPVDGRPALEIGYWLGADVRGRGFAREAVRGVLEALAARAPQALVVAQVHPDNAASARLLADVGFVDSGTDGFRPGRRLMVHAAHRVQ